MNKENKYKLTFKECFKNMVLVLLFCFALLVPFLSYNCGYRDALLENKDIQVISNDLKDVKESKKNIIDISVNKKSLQTFDKTGTYTFAIDVVNNAHAGFLFFDAGEDPTNTSPGNSAILFGYSYEIFISVKYDFDLWYVNSVKVIFTPKFSQTIPVDQYQGVDKIDLGIAQSPIEYEYIINRTITSVNSVLPVANVKSIVFETEPLYNNGLYFENKISLRTTKGWISEFFSTPVYVSNTHANNFFKLGVIYRFIHKYSHSISISDLGDIFFNTYLDYFDNSNVKVETTFNFIWAIITNAVNSVLNAFSYEIFPNIPIYALICIPLILSLFLFVLKVVRK